MKSENTLGFDPEVSEVILKVLEDEIVNSRQFGILEQKIFFKLRPFLKTKKFSCRYNTIKVEKL